MKKAEWVTATIFIVIGLMCLTMVIIISLGHYSTFVFLGILFQICLWFVIPLLILIIMYIAIKTYSK
ncbi:hypothetical protein BKP45_15930 [Anaerobacillus alkalidiazotrophicus]|uniref:Uncharacterized protein n=1 Tax=Anaerobacillus alkalidiazotrophicus TaxID=472963 RepID=A0A1S2M1R6_9BACI|nr:hypothetical protein [Anaerobacillus alkalidiazotrophicus]OIJ18682.1 hypothetical protein BKP45_15930 [Anaerobacillus alkalidiazotrophicus]